MIKGKQIRLFHKSGTPFGAETSSSITLHRDMEQHSSIPSGGANSEEWAEYHAGNKSWGVKFEGFVDSELGEVGAAEMMDYTMPGISLEGELTMTDKQINADAEGLAKVSVAFAGNGWPNVITY